VSDLNMKCRYIARACARIGGRNYQLANRERCEHYRSRYYRLARSNDNRGGGGERARSMIDFATGDSRNRHSFRIHLAHLDRVHLDPLGKIAR
jgi:hypothetical protein